MSNEICVHCEEVPTKVSERTDEGPVCTLCYALKAYYSPWRHKKCVDCKEVRRVARRRDNGDPVCQTCVYKDPTWHKECFICELVKPVAKHNTFGKPICALCVSRGFGGPRRKTNRIIRIRGITPTRFDFRRRELPVAC